MPTLDWRAIAWRVVLIAESLLVWFATQAMLGARHFPENGIGDGLFALTAGLNGFLQTHPLWAERLLITSSLGLMPLVSSCSSAAPSALQSGHFLRC